MTINNLNAVFELTLQVQLPGRPPYAATTRTKVGRAMLGSVRPGMTVTVRFPFQGVYRVPAAKLAALVPGGRVRVAYLADDPSRSTTIDWARVG